MISWSIGHISDPVLMGRRMLFSFPFCCSLMYPVITCPAPIFVLYPGDVMANKTENMSDLWHSVGTWPNMIGLQMLCSWLKCGDVMMSAYPVWVVRDICKLKYGL